MIHIDFQKRELPVGPPPGMKIAREDLVKQMEGAGFALVAEHSLPPLPVLPGVHRALKTEASLAPGLAPRGCSKARWPIRRTTSRATSRSPPASARRTTPRRWARSARGRSRRSKPQRPASGARAAGSVRSPRPRGTSPSARSKRPSSCTRRQACSRCRPLSHAEAETHLRISVELLDWSHTAADRAATARPRDRGENRPPGLRRGAGGGLPLARVPGDGLLLRRRGAAPCPSGRRGAPDAGLRGRDPRPGARPRAPGFGGRAPARPGGTRPERRPGPRPGTAGSTASARAAPGRPGPPRPRRSRSSTRSKLHAADDRQRYLARLFLGRLAAARGHVDDAVGFYRRALEAWPDSQAARLALAQALEQSSGPSVAWPLVAGSLAASGRLDRTRDPWWAYLFGPPGQAQASLERLWNEALGR